MQNEDKNHTSNINVFPVLHTIFFLLGCVRGGGGEKWIGLPRWGQ